MKNVIKRTVSFVLVFVMVFSILTVLPSELFHSTYVHAAEAISELADAKPEIYENDDFMYTLTDSYTKVRIMGWKQEGDEVVIPDTIEGKRVTSIGPEAFSYSSIKSVILSSNIDTICEYAFADCTSLSSVNFAESNLKTIGDCAFRRTQFTELVFPDTLETIGENAFIPYLYNGYWYNNEIPSLIQKITFGANLKTIGSHAFYSNKVLSEIIFTGDKLKSIGESAFSGCTALTSLNITGDYAEICGGAFYGCSKLESVTLSGVETLGNNGAFEWCTNLKTFTADSTLINIGKESFEYDRLLETLVWESGSGSGTIGSYAFSECGALQSIVIPDQVESISDYVFYKSNSLTSVSFGSGLNDLSGSAFSENTSLTDITVSPDNGTYKSVDNVLYSKDGKTLVFFKKNGTGEYRIPDGIEAISPYAFENCQFSKVTFPGSVKTVGEYAFKNCTALTEVVFEDSDSPDKVIGNYAFSNCTSLASIDFGNAVKSIGDYAFYKAPITSIAFPDSLEAIGNSAFESCTSIETIDFGTGIKTIGDKAFYLNSKLTEVDFPGSELTGIGSWAFGFDKLINGINIQSEMLKSIGERAFSSCEGLESVTISGDNAVIGNDAFSGCKSIETVTLSGVETLSEYSFTNCINFESFTADDSLKTIGEYTFNGCYLLENVNIGSNVNSIGRSAFNYCSSLKSFTIPDGVTYIQDYTFRNCAALETVNIGSGVTRISGNAFEDDTSLSEFNVSGSNTTYSSADGVLYNKAKTAIIISPKNKSGSITIPDTVTTITDYAFQNSPNITSVVIGRNVQKVGKYAFSGCPALESVTFAESGDVTKVIDESAFADCPSLESVTLGNAVTRIEKCAFAATALTQIVFPEGLERIGDYAFSPYAKGEYGTYKESSLENATFGSEITYIGVGAFYCTALTKLIIPGSNLSSIGTKAFYNCDDLKSVSISGKNAGINDSAFSSCDNLESVSLHGVKYLADKGVFNYCRKLQTFTADNDLESIGEYTFQNDELLYSVNMGTGVNYIGKYAFDSCSALTSIELSDKLHSISDYTFNKCTYLESISLGSKLSSISKYAFSDANNLRNITISDENEYLKSVDNVVYSKDGKTLVLFSKARTGEFTVPDGVETIGTYAFWNCRISKVNLPATVNTVSEYAFQGNTNLSSVCFEEGEEVDRTIGRYAFADCSRLWSIDFGGSLKSIENYAFYQTMLNEITFPEDLQTIGHYAFAGVTRLQNVDFAGNELTYIGEYAFSTCTGLKSIAIRGNNADIGRYSFFRCSNLKDVTFNGVKSIYSNSFYYCNAIETIRMSNDVTDIGEYAFQSATALKELVLSKNLSNVGYRAFVANPDLTVYCHEDTYSHEYALTLDGVTIEFIRDNYYVTNLRAVELSSKSVTFAWSKPKGFDNIDHYIINKDGTKLDETNSLSYSETGLTPGETYTYSVMAVDTDGLISEEKTLSITTACSSVYNIELPNNADTIGGLFPVKLIAIMSNNLSKSGATAKFEYSRDGEEWSDICDASLLPSGTSYAGYWDLTDVKSGEYTLRFTITDKDGGVSFLDKEITVDRTHPAAIDELTITPLATSIDLAWQISKEFNTEIYRVYRRADNEEEFELISEIRDRNTTYYSDTDVTEDMIYEYYVVGTDEFGQESLMHEVVSAGITDDVTPPTFTSISPTSNNFIFGNKKFTVKAADNVGVTKIELLYSQDSAVPNSEWTLFASHNGSLFDKEADTTLLPDGVVYVKAKIYDGNNNFVFSPAYKYYSDNHGPEKVKNVECIQSDGTIITISWSEVADDDLSYFVVERRNSDGEYEWAAQTSATNGVNIRNLTPESEYTFRVIAYDRFGNRGEESDPITISTEPDTFEPVITDFTPYSGYFKEVLPLKFTVSDDYLINSIKIQTSPDEIEWSDAVTLKAKTPSKTVSFEYSLYLGQFEEGPLYVRGIAYDGYGNATPINHATTYQYVVDRTAPDAPTGVRGDSATPEEHDLCYVNVSWNPVTGDNSMRHYNVYRSDSEGGAFKLIKGAVQAINTYDYNVEYGKNYYYKVEAVDYAGNISPKSQAVSCKVKDDEDIPVIHNAYPVDGSYIGAKSRVVSIAASDNARLDTIKVEYKTNSLLSSWKTLREITGNARNSCELQVTLPMDEFDDNTEVTLRITAADASGNQAEEKEFSYTVDKKAAEIKGLALTKTYSNVYTASWTTDDEDVNCFYIYKKTSNDKDYILFDKVEAQVGKTNYSYTDDEVAISDRLVSYKIESYDRVGNVFSAETEALMTTGTIKPKAVLDCPSTMIVESQYFFDATGSSDDLGITCYEFDFGDGSEPSINTGGTTTHIYYEKGVYTISLTVTDTDGNTDTVRKQITVTDRNLVSNVYVTVKDDSGNVLPYTDVYADMGEENEQRGKTNASGLACFELTIGTHIISSYKNSDYLPVKLPVTVTGNDLDVTLVLVNEPIVTGEFEIKRMTLNEIEAAGIDIHAAENRNVVEVKVTVYYEEVQYITTFAWNGVCVCSPGNYEPIYIKRKDGGNGKLIPWVVSPAIHGEGSVDLDFEPTLLMIDVPVEFSYTKDFFDVKLHILNNASEDFSILDSTVKLNVPDGLTIVDSNYSSAKSSVYIDEIKGQTQKTVSWILRGDKPGEYDISADFTGVVSYFNEPISVQFAPDEPITVMDSSSLAIEVQTAAESYNGKIFYNTKVTNNGETAIEGFEWNPLIESFVDEYVDADGNSYEMEEQRTTLEPGESFIYHYYKEVDKEYTYLKNLIEDAGSNGAKVTVNPYPISHFTDEYTEKYPPENKDFVFYVKHKNGELYENVEGANIRLNNNTVLTTDSNGEAVVPAEDRDKIKTNSVLVTKEGFYDNEHEFGGLQHNGDSTVIELYGDDEFDVEDVRIEGESVLTGKSTIAINDVDLDGTPSNTTFIAKVYGDIKAYDIYQNGNMVESVKKLVDKEKYLYAIVCPSAAFELGEGIEFKVKDQADKEIVKPLNISVIELDKNITSEFPIREYIVMAANIIYDWLDDFTFNFKLTDSSGLSFAFNEKKRTLTVGVNVSQTVWQKANSDNDSNSNNNSNSEKDLKNLYGVISKGKNIFKEVNTALRDERQKALGLNGKSLREKLNSSKWSSKINFSASGTLEFKVNYDGSLEYNASNAYFGLSVGFGYDVNFLIGPVPVTVGFNFTGSASCDAAFEKTSDSIFGILNADAKIGGKMDLSAGVGFSILSGGVYGSLSIIIDYVLASTVKEEGAKYLTIAGECGLYVKALFFEEKLKIFSDKCVIPLNDKKGGENPIGDIYNSDSYTLNESIMTCNPYWANPVATGVGTTTLLENAYSGTPAQIAVCGDKAVMVYQGVDRNADSAANALTLYYSVYDPETLKWSKPKKIESNRQADFDFKLVSNGDKAYVLYTQANSELSADCGLSDVTKKIDVYSAEFDSASETFAGFNRLTSDESYDTMPTIKTIGGSPTAVWVSNSEGDPFLTEGTNTLKLSKLENGEWSAPQTVASTEETILNCSLAASGRTPVAVYTADSDNDLLTTEDRKLVVLNTSSNESQTIAQGVTSSVEVGELMGNDVVMWYDNDEAKMKQYNVKTSAITSIEDIPSSGAKEFKLVSDENGKTALVFVYENIICAKYFNTETETWSDPVEIASSDNTIENISAQYVNGKLNVTYYDTAVTDNEKMTVESDLKTAVAANTPKPEIIEASVDHESIVPGEQAEMAVTVMNNSSEPTGNLSFTVTNYDGTVLGSYTTETVSLKAGEIQDFVIPFTAPDEIVNRDVIVTVTDSTKTGSSSKKVKLAIVDYGIYASQLHKDDGEYIKAYVYNNTSYTSPATLEVYDRFTGEVFYSINIPKIEKDYPMTALIKAERNYVDKNGYISVRIVTKADDEYDMDNADMFQYIPGEAYDDPELLIGDVNLDGEIDINDATAISKHLVNLITLDGEALAVADINGDADIDINDVTCIQKYLAGFTKYGSCGQKLVSNAQ